MGAHNTTVHGCYLDKNEAGLGWAGLGRVLQYNAWLSCAAISKRTWPTPRQDGAGDLIQTTQGGVGGISETTVERDGVCRHDTAGAARIS